MTLAQKMGDAYDAINSINLTLAVILFVTATVQTIRLICGRGLFPLTVQKRVHFASTFGGVMYLCRSIDFEGLAGIIPRDLDLLLSDIVTTTLCSVILCISFAWAKAVNKMKTSDTSDSLIYLGNLHFGLQVLVWVGLICLSILQSTHTPRWIFGSTQEVLQCCLFAVLMVAGWCNGCQIWQEYRRISLSSSSHVDEERFFDGSDDSSNRTEDLAAYRVIARRLLLILCGGSFVMSTTIAFHGLLLAQYLQDKPLLASDEVEFEHTIPVNAPRAASEMFEFLCFVALLFFFSSVSGRKASAQEDPYQSSRAGSRAMQRPCENTRETRSFRATSLATSPISTPAGAGGMASHDAYGSWGVASDSRFSPSTRSTGRAFSRTDKYFAM